MKSSFFATSELTLFFGLLLLGPAHSLIFLNFYQEAMDVLKKLLRTPRIT